MSHAIRIAASDLAFACAEGQTVLDAALAAGVELPYSCRTGVCGNCAGGVAQGSVRGLRGADQVRNELCAPDQVLFCQCLPTSDLVIAPTSYRRIDPARVQRIATKVFRIERPCDDVTLLHLRPPAGVRVKFRAGQYLQVLMDDAGRRSYSMANPPQESDAISLHVRLLEGGAFSGRRASMQPGEPVPIELPFGSFSLREETQRPLLFVAGGTGFAPVKSMLDDMVKRKIDRPATLVWGVRRAEHLYLMAAVERWRRLLPGFRFQAVVSDGPAPPAPAVSGLAHTAIAALCPDLAGHEVYSCGAPPMVAAVREAAVALGLAREDFHSDVFVTTAPAAQG